MDSLLKQIRSVRFSDQEPEELRRQRIPPRKSVSFKEDKRTKSNTYSSDGEFETVIAAAAYAISSLEENTTPTRKKSNMISEERQGVGRSKTQKETPTNKRSESGGMFGRWLSIKDAKEDNISPELGKSMGNKAPIGATPSKKRSTTISDNSRRGQEPNPTRSSSSSPTKPAATPPPSRKWTGTKIESNDKVRRAQTWEEAAMAKINRRFKKMSDTILEWENKKKGKAKSKLDKKERELERKRGRAMQEYREDMSRIDKIAGGARALAEERKRNEEAKMREKARKNRGKGPKTCFFF